MFVACSDVTMSRERGDSPSRRCHRLMASWMNTWMNLPKAGGGGMGEEGGGRGGLKRPVRAEIG